MLIGHRNTFAIEFSVSEPRFEHRLFGHVCYWVNSQMIGDYQSSCTLNGAVGALVQLLAFTGDRYNHDLINRAADDAFSSIFGPLYVDSGQSDVQVQSDKRNYWRFQTIPFGLDVFDYWMCFLIEDDEIGRFLCKDFRLGDRAEVQETLIRSGEFYFVICTFTEYMQTTYPECGSREELLQITRRTKWDLR
jgi:hypothetical protein